MKPGALLLPFAFNFLGASIVPGQNEQPFYQIDWKTAQEIGHPWKTQGQIMDSPSGKRRFLGKIPTHSPTRLTLKNLPPHEVLTIEIELFLVGTWDGKQPPWGDDIVTIALDDGRRLLHTTFSNCMSNDWSGIQDYPKDLGSRDELNCFTGASHIGELGYEQTWGRYEPKLTVPIDSTYQLHFSVPHRTDSMQLTIRALLNKDDEGEAQQWLGIGKVSVIAKPESPVDEKAWAISRERLFNSFPPISNHGFWELMQHPGRFRSDIQLLESQSRSIKAYWWYDRAISLLTIPNLPAASDK